MSDIILGVDIGGSHITSALIDQKGKNTINDSFFRSFVNSKGCSDEILDAWATTMKRSILGTSLPNLKISIAMPGPMDYGQGICYIKDQDKYDALFNVDLKKVTHCSIIYTSYILLLILTMRNK